MKCPRCQQENPPRAKFCLECGTPLKHPSGKAQAVPSYAGMQRALAEALEQQTATAEILRIISTSPANVQPVFEAIVRAASRLCESPRSNLMLIVGDHVELAARCIDGYVKDVRDLSDSFHRAYPMLIEQSGLAGIVVREGRTFATDDAQRDERFSRARREAATQAGYHSLVGVPMMRGGQVLGALNVARTEIRP